jgi:hypothetical protein
LATLSVHLAPKDVARIEAGLPPPAVHGERVNRAREGVFLGGFHGD